LERGVDRKIEGDREKEVREREEESER